MRPYLKITKAKKGWLEAWLKWQRTCLVSPGPEFNPQYQGEKKIREITTNHNKVPGFKCRIVGEMSAECGGSLSVASVSSGKWEAR
jgi:hypothetical protein